MSHVFNQDFRDFLSALNKNKVAYVLVGGYSVILHGYLRNTGDMDLWVKKTKENYRKLVLAFQDFGMPVFDMTEEAFLRNPDLDVFTFGRPPVSIDIMTAVKGLQFVEVYENAEWKEVDGLMVSTVSLQHLLKAKKASNRPKDIDDISHLT
jgi:predicted nucleotidyltransferase